MIVSSEIESGDDLHEVSPFEKVKNGVWQYFGFPAENGQFTKTEEKGMKYFVSCVKRKRKHHKHDSLFTV